MENSQKFIFGENVKDNNEKNTDKAHQKHLKIIKYKIDTVSNLHTSMEPNLTFLTLITFFTLFLRHVTAVKLPKPW